MNYLTWNKRIAEHFFKREMDGRPVHLYVTEELIGSLGGDSGVNIQDFIKAVKIGLLGVAGKGVCQKALESMDYWKYRSGGRGYPLYIGYLALFVLAAGIEGDFSSQAYYPRLRELLGEEPTCGQYPDFHQMRQLWDDLERWANEDKAGELGIFKINIGETRWIHVGRPIAQTLLTEDERKTLPVFFAEADLDPTSPPSERAIASLLVKHGCKYLLPRTRRLLESNGDREELRLALIEWIVDELRDWDGTAELSSEDGTKVYGLLRLCCKLDTIAGRATMTLRCTTKHEFPEDNLLLSLDGNSLLCNEDTIPWSSPIRSESDNKNIDASKFDWCKGLRIQSPDPKWCFKLPASPIRVFIEGKGEGLPGLVEVGQLPKGAPFYLVAREQCCQLLERWGESSCQGFEKLSVTNGLPPGWNFFKVAAARSDEIVKGEYPMLSWQTTVRLELDGGIRINRGNQFFNFAPPKIVLKGGDESVKVYCNETLLNCTPEGVYKLPKDVPSDTRMVIKAHREGGNFSRSCSLSLVEDFPWQSQTSIQHFDCFGHSINEVNKNGVAGALVQKFDCPAFDFNTSLPVQGKQRIFFVGKEPGQVAIVPDEPLPTNWLPVWAVSLGRRRGQAMFCGTCLEGLETTQSTCKDKKKLRKWKEILWHNRKKILYPTQPRLRELWKKFQKEAEHVKG